MQEGLTGSNLLRGGLPPTVITFFKKSNKFYIQPFTTHIYLSSKHAIQNAMLVSNKRRENGQCSPCLQDYIHYKIRLKPTDADKGIYFATKVLCPDCIKSIIFFLKLFLVVLGVFFAVRNKNLMVSFVDLSVESSAGLNLSIVFWPTRCVIPKEM